MSEPDKPAVPAHKSDEERSAFFAELMRIDRKQNPPPVSGFAAGALGYAVVFVGLALFFGIFNFVGGAAALVFGALALLQIKRRERRGLGFVLAVLVVLTGAAAVIMIALDRNLI